MAGEKEEKKEVLYVGVKNPIEMRRTILETTKDSVEMLQKYEKFRAVREEKIATIKQLQEQIKDITKIVTKLKTALPTVDIRIRLHKEQEKVEAEKKAAKQAAEKPKKKEAKQKKQAATPKKTKELSDLEKLEAELSHLEQRLGKI